MTEYRDTIQHPEPGVVYLRDANGGGSPGPAFILDEGLQLARLIPAGYITHLKDIEAAHQVASERERYVVALSNFQFLLEMLRQFGPSPDGAAERDLVAAHERASATAGVEGWREAIEECAAWHDRQRPELSGLDGLADDAERGAILADNRVHMTCTAALRALAEPPL